MILMVDYKISSNEVHRQTTYPIVLMYSCSCVPWITRHTRITIILQVWLTINTQAGAVISRSTFTWYWTHHCRNWSKLSIIVLTHQRHPMPRPDGRALGYLSRTIRGDVFKHTYDYLCVKSQRALFSLNKQLNHLGTLSPKLSLHLFKTIFEPILTYGSEIWGNMGYQQKRLWWNRYILFSFYDISPRSQIFYQHYCSIWRIGFLSPSLVAHTRVLCYYKRSLHMSPHKLARRAFESQMSLHNQGFNTWIGKVKELSRNINIDIDNADPGTLKNYAKRFLKTTSLKNGMPVWIMASVLFYGRTPLLNKHLKWTST